VKIENRKVIFSSYVLDLWTCKKKEVRVGVEIRKKGKGHKWKRNQSMVKFLKDTIRKS
jgi:ribosomal protein L31E